jgi:MOSC domain-containing protein YiiM
MGRLEQIWIKRARRGPMDAVSTAQLRAGLGIVGNANQGGKRQVTMLSREDWQRVTGPVATPDPRVRRANLLFTGITLHGARGKTLRVGPVRIRIYGETRPCEQMDDAVPGLRGALSVPWGGGGFGEVLDDGQIAIGDEAAFE